MAIVPGERGGVGGAPPSHLALLRRRTCKGEGEGEGEAEVRGGEGLRARTDE